jgi:hypothetical protein
MEVYLVRDQELLEDAPANVQERWKELNAEIEEPRATEKGRYLSHRSAYHIRRRRQFEGQELPPHVQLSGDGTVDGAKTLPIPFPSHLDMADEG